MTCCLSLVPGRSHLHFVSTGSFYHEIEYSLSLNNYLGEGYVIKFLLAVKLEYFKRLNTPTGKKC